MCLLVFLGASFSVRRCSLVTVHGAFVFPSVLGEDAYQGISFGLNKTFCSMFALIHVSLFSCSRAAVEPAQLPDSSGSKSAAAEPSQNGAHDAARAADKASAKAAAKAADKAAAKAADKAADKAASRATEKAAEKADRVADSEARQKEAGRREDGGREAGENLRRRPSPRGDAAAATPSASSRGGRLQSDYNRASVCSSGVLVPRVWNDSLRYKCCAACRGPHGG